MMNWHWPQVVYALMLAANMGLVLSRFGQRKDDKYDLVDLLGAPGIVIWLLYMGGFWTPAS
jgi:hypothetical protein